MVQLALRSMRRVTWLLKSNVYAIQHIFYYTAISISMQTVVWMEVDGGGWRCKSNQIHGSTVDGLDLTPDPAPSRSSTSLGNDENGGGGDGIISDSDGDGIIIDSDVTSIQSQHSFSSTGFSVR
jgi:hypothetical protein